MRGGGGAAPLPARLRAGAGGARRVPDDQGKAGGVTVAEAGGATITGPRGATITGACGATITGGRGATVALAPPGPARSLVDEFEHGLSAPICLTWELT